MAIDFKLKHKADDGTVLYEAYMPTGTVLKMDVFPDYAQVQLGAGFVKRLPSEADARAYVAFEFPNM